MMLENKVAIITGGANGIGEATARKFISEGAKVIVSDVNSEKGEKLAKEIGAIFVKTDVSNSKEVKGLVETGIKEFGRVDIMVNNAGIAEMGAVQDEDVEGFDKVIAVNLKGVFYGIKYASEKMKESGGGAIVNTSSIAGVVGFEGAAGYCASKGGINQLTRESSVDLGKFGIRINAVAPGVIETAMTEGFLKDEGFVNQVKQRASLGRTGRPEEIANVIAFLASDEASYITGAVVCADGGWTAN